MILILAEEKDHSTNKVIDWLNYYQEEFLRISESSTVEIVECNLQTNDFIINVEQPKLLSSQSASINLKDVEAYWYRRGIIRLEANPKNETEDVDEITSGLLKNFKKKEHNILIEYLNYFLEDRFHIGSFYDNDINKLHALHEANKAGLKIPKTSICSTLTEIKAKFSEGAITKAFYNNAAIYNGHVVGGNTVKVNPQDLDDSFYYSLIQEQVNKKYEIRSFYLDGAIYSASIMSQEHLASQLDCRGKEGLGNNKVRIIPYQLDSETEDKLRGVMQKLGLNTGSIDMMVNHSNEYIFLEVNPVGQYDYISEKCCYDLDQKIAQLLINGKRKEV